MLGTDRFTWIFLGVFLLAAFALRSIWTSGGHATKVKIIWSVIALVPIVGPLGWFVLGRTRKRRQG